MLLDAIPLVPYLGSPGGAAGWWEEEEEATRERKRKTPLVVQVASGWLVVLWSARQSRRLGICWVGERRHLIRGVNGPAISLRLRGAGVGVFLVWFFFFFPLYFLLLIILWCVVGGSWEARSDSRLSDRREQRRHFSLINYIVALEETKKRARRFLIG